MLKYAVISHLLDSAVWLLFLTEIVWISQWLSYSGSIGYVIKIQVICPCPCWLLACLCKRFQIAIQNLLFCDHLRHNTCWEKSLLSWKWIPDWTTTYHRETRGDCSSLLSSVSYPELPVYAISVQVKMEAWGTFFMSPNGFSLVV